MSSRPTTKQVVIALGVVALVVTTVAVAPAQERTAKNFVRGVLSNDSAVLRRTSALGRNPSTIAELSFESKAGAGATDVSATPAWVTPIRGAWFVEWNESIGAAPRRRETLAEVAFTVRGWRVVSLTTSDF